MTAPVFAAFPWPSNAELIAAVHELGYLLDDDHVLDPTYEKGVWWKAWRPEKLTTHHRAVDGSDFRSLPFGNNRTPTKIALRQESEAPSPPPRPNPPWSGGAGHSGSG